MLAQLLTGSDTEQLLKKAFELWDESAIPPLGKGGLGGVSHPDIHILPNEESATSIGVGEVRGLVKVLQLKPMQAETKLVIIKNAHLLTREAQNSLLKTLEEPPKHVQIVLITAKPNSLLPTILSRVLQKRVLPLTKGELEGVPAEINEDFEAQLKALLQTPPAQRLIQTPLIAKDRESAREFILQCLHYFHNKLVTQPNFQTSKLPIDTLKFLQRSLKFLDSNTHPQLTLDNLLLKLPFTSGQLRA